VCSHPGDLGARVLTTPPHVHINRRARYLQVKTPLEPPDGGRTFVITAG
jgi:hypothetical protein